MATITSPRTSSPASQSRITSPTIPSANNTPSSSVRASFEIPVRDNVSATPTNAATVQRRNRAALRDYYNLKAKSGTSPSRPDNLSRTASITSTTSDSTVTSAATLTTNDPTSLTLLSAQLDDPSLDAEKFIAELLKTSTLHEILRIESTLVSEVKNLDGERKALVYDNYSKLIKAVSTIGEMQKGMRDQGDGKAGLDGVKELEGKIQGLIYMVKEIKGDRKETGMQSTVEARRHREDKRKRELVKWVLDAPKRLEQFMDDGEQKQAEEEWKQVQEILNKWEGVKGVDEVKKACETIMKQDASEDSHHESND